MSNDWTAALEIGEAGAKLIGFVVELIQKALKGDQGAQRKLKRVEQILTTKSPTETAFERADEVAAGKPSGGDAA
jgi:hypothetical protein